jgi:hypothetical protein
MAEETPDVVSAEEPIVATEVPAPTPEEPEIPAKPAVDPEPEDEEPPVRKSVKDHIIERKDRKIAKLEGKADEEPDAGEDRPITLKDLETVLAPLKRSLIQSEDEKELQAAFSKYPDAKKMEKTVRRYMENPAYAQVPAEFIIRALQGAKDTAKAKADEEAKGTRQGGHTRRPSEAKPKTAWDMTPEEFQKSVTGLMSGNPQ